MCGRYRLSKRKQLIEEYFEIANEVDWEPRHNIAPSQNVGIIHQGPSRPRREFSHVRSGLIPSWAKEASIGHKMINAYSETVADKPAFSEPFKNRRCLIPADGFYEWRRTGKAKQAFHFGMQDDSLFAFAGTWDRWKDGGGNLQTMAASSFLHRQRYYTKSGYFSHLDDVTIDRLLEVVVSLPSAGTQIELAYLGGDASQVLASETAFGDRSAPCIVNLLANWSEASADDVQVSWIRGLFNKLRIAMTPGVYVNFMSGDEQDRLPEAYHERWERVVAVKT